MPIAGICEATYFDEVAERWGGGLRRECFC